LKGYSLGSLRVLGGFQSYWAVIRGWSSIRHSSELCWYRYNYYKEICNLKQVMSIQLMSQILERLI